MLTDASQNCYLQQNSDPPRGWKHAVIDMLDSGSQRQLVWGRQSGLPKVNDVTFQAVKKETLTEKSNALLFLN